MLQCKNDSGPVLTFTHITCAKACLTTPANVRKRPELGSNDNNVESNMTTTILSTPSFAPVADKASSERPSFFKRLMARLAAGQERRARAIVHAHLALQPDEVLKRLGWTDAEIAALRRQGDRSVTYPL